MTLIECVPNFSEGRDKRVVQRILDGITSVPIHMLDWSSDPDHNRTVVTFAGKPEDVLEAAFQGIKVASKTINMDSHQGVHPRIGATDVVPLIPLRGVSLEACAELARTLARRVAIELGIPIFLYESAALRPERRNLAYVRKHPYEQLKQTIKSDPDRIPDYGPGKLSTAGATAIGARMPLIAFNAFLNTTNVEIAKSIAYEIRESGNGLPYLKALGLFVDGRAQVSMNVIDYRHTSLFEVMQILETTAENYGVKVTETELIGLIPQAALFDTAISYLKLPAVVRERILEYRLGETTGDFRELPFE